MNYKYAHKMNMSKLQLHQLKKPLVLTVLFWVTVVDPSARAEVNRVDGLSTATIRIVEFTDFNCPYCKKYYKNLYPIVKAEFVDSGLAVYEIRDFPMKIHLYSRHAAKASRCVGDISEYRKIREIFMTTNDRIDLEKIKETWKLLGLNYPDLKKCSGSDESEALIESDIQFGVMHGITAVPSFLVMSNDPSKRITIKVVGPVSVQPIKNAVDKILSKVGER